MVTREDLDAQLQHVTAASGSVGQFTVSRNAHGRMVRTRVTPNVPLTDLRRWSIGTFRILARRWAADLTAAQRLSWDVYAAHVPYRNRLGAVHRLTGHQHFLRSNRTRTYADLPYIPNAPTTFNLGEYGWVGFKAIGNNPLLTVTWDTDHPFAHEPGSIIFLHATLDYSPTVRSFRPPIRFLGYLHGVATPPRTIPLGYLPVTGNRIFLRWQVGRVDGRLTYPLNTSTLVMAP